MIVVLTTDNERFEYNVESTFEPGKISYKDPNVDAMVYVYFRLNEVLIRREGEITSQEVFIMNQSTMGYYRQENITFKTIVKTKLLNISPTSIQIEYDHEIDGLKTSKTLDLRLFI